jgi:acyl-CoA thioester hydrolase
MTTKVYYDDTDAGGIVYHTNYLKYCERARSDLFFNKGLLPIIDGGHFVVRKVECDFLKSAKFGDTLEVKTKLLEFKKVSFLLKQTIFLNNVEIFIANILLVFVKDGKPKRIDKNTKELLETLFKI